MAKKVIEVPALPQFALPDRVQAPEQLPPLPLAEEDGIYFGLDADQQYHPASGLGSGDVKRLFRNASEFWWNSDMNPLKPKDKETEFKKFGSAVHKRVLEGVAHFDTIYQCEYTGDDLLVTDADLKAWITKSGNIPAKGNKPDRITQALAIDPNVKIEDEIKERAVKARKLILDADAYARILISAKLIAENPDLETAFAGGMPEVAVVWTEIVDGEPVKCKALLDYLKVLGIGDLKSTSNPKEIDFEALCKIRFSENRMDIQAAHYLRAREFFAQFIAEGKVYGDHDPEWLARVAAQQNYGFAFVFFQSTGAPSTWATSLYPLRSVVDDETGEVEEIAGNPILDVGADHRAIALRNYVNNRRQYGEAMWLKRGPIKELDISELPGWFARS
jgi:hypothetical protein